MKSLFLAVSGAALALAASTAPVQAATNLLVNGGFDLDNVPNGNYNLYNAGDLVGGGGWTVVGSGPNSGLNINANYTEANLAFNTQSGANAFDLTAGGNTGPTDGVLQNVSTTPGQAYTLSFFLGNADGSGNANYTLPSSLTLSVGGAGVGTYTNANVTTGGINWKSFTYSFVATSSSTAIQFNNATPGPNPDNYAGLDTVSLVSGAPEPAAWLMMITGFGIAGGALRGRRRSVLRTA